MEADVSPGLLGSYDLLETLRPASSFFFFFYFLHELWCLVCAHGLCSSFIPFFFFVFFKQRSPLHASFCIHPPRHELRRPHSFFLLSFLFSSSCAFFLPANPKAAPASSLQFLRAAAVPLAVASLVHTYPAWRDLHVARNERRLERRRPTALGNGLQKARTSQRHKWIASRLVSSLLCRGSSFDALPPAISSQTRHTLCFLPCVCASAIRFALVSSSLLLTLSLCVYLLLFSVSSFSGFPGLRFPLQTEPSALQPTHFTFADLQSTYAAARRGHLPSASSGSSSSSSPAAQTRTLHGTDRLA